MQHLTRLGLLQGDHVVVVKRRHINTYLLLGNCTQGFELEERIAEHNVLANQ